MNQINLKKSLLFRNQVCATGCIILVQFLTDQVANAKCNVTSHLVKTTRNKEFYKKIADCFKFVAFVESIYLNTRCLMKTTRNKKFCVGIWGFRSAMVMNYILRFIHYDFTG